MRADQHVGCFAHQFVTDKQHMTAPTIPAHRWSERDLITDNKLEFPRIASRLVACGKR